MRDERASVRPPPPSRAERFDVGIFFSRVRRVVARPRASRVARRRRNRRRVTIDIDAVATLERAVIARASALATTSSVERRVVA